MLRFNIDDTSFASLCEFYFFEKEKPLAGSGSGWQSLARDTIG